MASCAMMMLATLWTEEELALRWIINEPSVYFIYCSYYSAFGGAVACKAKQKASHSNKHTLAAPRSQLLENMEGQ